jgi:hypothetical protein
LEQQRVHEAVTQIAHTNNHQGRRIVATGSLLAGGASIGQTTLDVENDTENLRKLVAETYDPLYQADFPALVGTTSKMDASKLPEADKMFLATPLSFVDVKLVNQDIRFDKVCHAKEPVEFDPEVCGTPFETFQEEIQQVAVLGPAPTLDVKRPAGITKWESQRTFLKRKVEAWMSQPVPKLTPRSRDNVDEDIFGKNSSREWPRMAPQDVKFAARCQADKQKCIIMEGMYKYADIQERRDEAAMKRLSDCKRRLHRLMTKALGGQPQALTNLIFENQFDANRFQYEI